jgi:hypothetical protein
MYGLPVSSLVNLGLDVLVLLVLFCLRVLDLAGVLAFLDALALSFFYCFLKAAALATTSCA